jgi:hypothetical protein
MLPIQDEDFKGHSRAVHVASAARYFRRMLRLRHMDFDHTLWLMLNLCATKALKQAMAGTAKPCPSWFGSARYPSAACPRRCVNPRHVYRSATYHRGTKNMWARDDPAFVVLLLYLLLVSVVAWSMGFGRCDAGPLVANFARFASQVASTDRVGTEWQVISHLYPLFPPRSFSPLSYLSLALYVLLVDFALIGGALATLCWWLANTHLIHREGRTQRQVTMPHALQRFLGRAGGRWVTSDRWGLPATEASSSKPYQYFVLGGGA